MIFACIAGPLSPVLQEVQVPLVSLDECRSTYRSLTDTRVIDERVLCAGLKNGGKDACQVIDYARKNYFIFFLIDDGYF